MDDCLIFLPEENITRQVISQLWDGYLIGEEGTVQDFLGVHIQPDEQGSLYFTQPGLMESIIKDLNLTDCHPKFTPAISVLHPDHDGHARTESWNYRSVIGKLNYLAQMTGPDILMAVHNCARYSTTPTYLYEQAVKCIGRYLATT